MANSLPKRADHRLNLLHRTTLRGLRKCQHCGCYNGIRALNCLNKQCARVLVPKQVTAAKRLSATTKVLDTVQLVSKTDAKLYSIQVPDKDGNHHRSFVQITDKTISSDDDGCIISRNAICYVDTCKYDSHDVNISCKHIKNALENSATIATATTIDMNVWYAMRMPNALKNRLWSDYQLSESRIPMVQRINRTMFVVKCDTTAAFPAGRLHVALTGGASYSCACKKIKILMSPNNSIVLENDRCEHLNLTVAALLSNAELKTEFHDHVQVLMNGNAVIPEPLDDCLLVTEDFISFSEKILNDCVEMSSSNGLTNETEDLSSSVPLIHVSNTMSAGDFDIKISDNLHSTLDNIQIVDAAMADVTQSLEFIDCQIELMDQFKLTDHIDLGNNEIHLNGTTDLFGEQIISHPDLFDTTDANNLPIDSSTVEANPVLSLANSLTDKLDQRRLLKPTANGFTTKSTSTNTKNARHINVDDDDLSCSDAIQFDHWLSSVVERINTTMNFNDDGRPPKLVFSVSHGFFNTLRNRFSIGSKRRLPSSTVVVDRGPYKGLTQYTWTFFSCSSIWKIFSNDSIPLETYRMFTKEPNGLYRYVEAGCADDVDAVNGDERYRKIKPTMYKTFLKLRSSNTVRRTSKNANELFNIEWIPNVLCRSKHGEMRLHFRFGHMKDDKIINVLSAGQK